MTSTLPPLVQAVSGAIGSATANALTYPFDLVTTRLQLERGARKDTGVFRAIQVLRGIFDRDGIEALYDGLSADTIATLLSNFFYFYFYSFLRSQVTSRRLRLNPNLLNKSTNRPYKPTMIEELILGFVAGVVSRAISTPLNIVTLRLQTERQAMEKVESDAAGSDDGSDEDTAESQANLKAVFASIYREEGLAGFWRGFRLSILLSLNPSISLTLFQLFRRIVAISRRSPVRPNPSPREAFIGGAISNSIAISLLYPLLLAKTRLQTSRACSLRKVLIDSYTGHFHRHPSISHHAQPKAFESLRMRHGGGKIRNLYQALPVQILKGFLNQGMTFLVKGRIEQLIILAYIRGGPWRSNSLRGIHSIPLGRFTVQLP